MFKKYDVVIMVAGNLVGTVEKSLFFQHQSRVQFHVLGTTFFKDVQNDLLVLASEQRLIDYLVQEYKYDPAKTIILAAKNNVTRQFVTFIQRNHKVEMVKQSMQKIALAVKSKEITAKVVQEFFFVFNELTLSAADIVKELHADDEAQVNLGLTEVNE